jgi:tripartite-type tricarboxylate transporter receptor subunit TctC
LWRPSQISYYRFLIVFLTISSHPWVATSNTADQCRRVLSWLNANHEKVSMETLGIGSSQQLCGVELQNITGVSWSLVPYRGAAPLLQDLLGGQIDLTCAPPAAALSLIQGGAIKAFAVAAKNRQSL